MTPKAKRAKVTRSDSAMLKSVHGALVDAGFRMGEIGQCEAQLVRELTAQRDELREALKECLQDAHSCDHGAYAPPDYCPGCKARALLARLEAKRPPAIFTATYEPVEGK